MDLAVYQMKQKRRNTAIIIVFFMMLLLSVLISLRCGYSSISAEDILRVILGGGSENEQMVIFSFRLPRIVLSIMVGMGLATAGCLLQAVTGNALADTGILGINAGAGLMVVLYVIVFGTQSAPAIFTLPFAALLGACGAFLLIYLLIKKRDLGISPFSMIMTGIAVQAGLTAFTTLLVIKLDDTQYAFVSSWQSGSIWGANWTFVLAILPWLSILLIAAMCKARVLDILGLREETAAGLGLRIKKEQQGILLIAVGLAGACVSVSGSISFVGLMAPHIARRLVGPRHHILIPVCALVGGVLVSTADTIARVVIQPSSLPTGVVVSVIGAPYFIYLLIARKGVTV